MAVLFSGKSVTVKKSISSADGLKLQRQLLNIGAITYLEPVNPSTIAHAPRPSTSPQAPAAKTPVASSHKSSSYRAPVAPALALQPIQDPHPFEAQHAQQDEELIQEKATFSFPAIGFSFGGAVALLLTVLGITCLLVFSPYPDLMVRKGFAFGAALTFLGIRKLRR